MSAPEATITEKGLYNPAQSIGYTLVEAADEAGYVCKVSTTPGSFNKTTAITDAPDGYNTKSTIPAWLQEMVAPTAGAAVAGVFVGFQALIPGQEAYLQLAAAASAVVCGDYIMCSTSSVGKVQPRNANTSTGACVVFAKALEAKAENAGGTIHVRIIATMYLPTGVY